MGPTLAVGALAILIFGLAGFDLARAWRWVDEMGPWAPVAFCAMYAAATAAALPGSLLTLAAGAKWGPVEGLAYVILGSNLGANLAFGIGRFVAQDRIARFIAGRPLLAAVETAVAREGWRTVLLLRLSPVVPFNLLNYALSLSRVSWREYAWATAVGMLPATALYVYLGSLVQVATQPGNRSPLEWTLFAAGLGATALVTYRVTKAARRALAERLGVDQSEDQRV